MKYSFIHIVVFTLGIILIPTSIILGQDIHFSQFNQAPASLNPALTGQFDGGYRIAGIYRSQWGSVTTPYSTFAFSGDAHNFMKQKGLGVGLDFFYDKAGDGNLGTVNFNASGSYSLGIGQTQKNHLTFGLQLGWAQRQIDPTQLVFDNQNGGGGSLETFNTGASYANASTGLVWETRFAKRKKLQLGIAIHNLTQPNINFYGSDNSKLAMRFTFHGNYQFKITQKIDLIPGILTMIQGPHAQITPGMNAKYILDNRSTNYRAVYLGLWTRTGDAAFISMGMDWNTLNVGLSYDFNYSKLTTASRYRGGFEFSVIYIFSESLPKRQHFKTCPDYI
tara:strand:- start:24591 stop:25595 length:1005 start_codon:yes stop_codon:yes gene_type:complete